tara:strand:- start:2313 stop:5945 length:3633 start_codon:yes stop_codon:yes gene_type:complete
MKKLLELYQDHEGKVSDKWNIYLSEYDRIFSPYRDEKIKLLEIGIQNGGSLEIWNKYFYQSEILVGCDINEKCRNLKFDSEKIRIVVGDANSEEVEKEIRSVVNQFDIIIDDGSHTSEDIIISFAKYLPYLKDGGVFVVEDLHCSYWEEFGGGLHDLMSSISFFKQLVDVINYEHWGLNKNIISAIEEFNNKYNVSFSLGLIEEIHSVEFVNSLCVIRKETPSKNRLGRRYIAGKEELVVSGHEEYQGRYMQAPAQKETNENSIHPLVRIKQRDDLIKGLNHQVEAAQSQLAERDRELELLSAKIGAGDVSLLERIQHLAEKERQLSEVLNSKSWKVTKPLRESKETLTQFRRAVSLIKPALQRGGGIRSTLSKVVTIYRHEGFAGIKRGFRLVESSASVGLPQVTDPVYLATIGQNAPEYLAPRVLIVAEFSIPQCKKYRVTQKQKMFEYLGVECNVVNWTDSVKALKALQTHSLVIFYRVPAFSNMLSIIQEAKRLNIPTYWEVDDLVFDRNVLLNSKSLAEFDKGTLNELVQGADLYLKAMLSCDKGIASTTGLAKAMQESGMSQVQVVENALDAQTMAVAEKVNQKRKTAVEDSVIRIVYGSGTNTHNVDFKEAVPALLETLATHSNVHFRLIGLLDLPNEFDQYESRIERIPVCSYEEYLESLAECDISIAPLEDYMFNDSKSNIKFLEASAVRVPSVCSPRAAFKSAITDGVNGFLCETNEEWTQAFLQLINSTELRQSMALKAHESILKAYSRENIATKQLQPVLCDFAKQKEIHVQSNKFKVLSINCFYKPRSFGGATIVAEELNVLLNKRVDFDIHMFTAVPTSVAEAYQVRRYEADGVNVFGMGLPDGLDEKAQFENPKVAKALNDVLNLVEPDIVHLHSIQGIGLTIIELCKEKNIKYVITLHDAWWVCGRQFMIDRYGKFCGQYVIDRDVCARCVNNASLNNERLTKMDAALIGASALLAPSRFFGDFFIANGYSEKKVIVNKNGVRKPSSAIKIRHDGPVRFGYVGGNTEIKGVHLIKKVFSELKSGEAHLIVVDNALNLGCTSYDPSAFNNIDSVEIVPAYTKETIDRFFASIDVLLFPTQCKESFGLTVREALARNVWVISTDAGGVVEDIISGKNGIIIPFSDEGKSLKQAVLESIRMIKNYSHGDEIELPNSQLTFFEDQAEELAEILIGVGKAQTTTSDSIIETVEYHDSNT